MVTNMGNSPYKFETHMHTSEGSACGRSDGAAMAEAYAKHGYAGIIITDHFFNGNCAVPRDLPWRERVDRFLQGYENARSAGEKLGLLVFPGWLSRSLSARWKNSCKLSATAKGK